MSNDRMKTSSALVLELRLAAALPRAQRGPGDEVIVVYNTRVPESKAVAEYYAKRRHVPAGQIFGFALTTNLDMSRAEFRDSLQKPLASRSRRKNCGTSDRESSAQPTASRRAWSRVIESKIRYAVLCYGVPVRILETRT